MALIAHPTNSLSERIIGAAIEVHRRLGPGLLESSYHACLRRELDLRGIGYQSQVELPLDYKGAVIGNGYVIDLLVEGSLVVEVKAVEKLQPVHSAQIMTYMRLRNISAGLLLNFNVARLPEGIRRTLL